MALEHERVHGQRVHPSRRPRWRAYAPALMVSTLAAALIVSVEPVVRFAAQATLGAHASITIAAGLVASIATLTAALCDRSPARWYIAGAFAVSLGANLAPPRWIPVPLLLLGLVGILAREIERGFQGITLGTGALTMHRPLKDPLTVVYEDIRAVHTAPAVDDAGTLILETEHGTVTARDLPAVADLQARIEARTGAFDIEDPEAAARQAREHIQDLVRGKTPA